MSPITRRQALAEGLGGVGGIQSHRCHAFEVAADHGRRRDHRVGESTVGDDDHVERPHDTSSASTRATGVQKFANGICRVLSVYSGDSRGVKVARGV